MLVLSRKTGEKIRIGDRITLEVRRVAGNRVTLAFNAPDDVRILRSELKAFEEGSASETAAKPPLAGQELRRNGLAQLLAARKSNPCKLPADSQRSCRLAEWAEWSI